MGFPRIVPWFDSKEWEQVYFKLYSPNAIENQIAVNKVKAWSSRGKLPQAIEITSILVEIGLQDQPQKFSTCSKREIQMLLSMSIIRFVNGIVDQAQKGNFASSQVGIAEQLGLPQWFVEIRHSATHDKLPSLDSLRRARVQALDWLDNNYWKVQQSSVKDVQNIVSELVTEYQSERLEFLKAKETPGFHKLSKLLSKITGTLSNENYSEILIPILLQPGLLVSKSKKYQPKKGEVFQNDNINVLLWEPLITFCEQEWNGFSARLLDSFVQATEIKQKSYRLCWIKYILSKYLTQRDDGEFEAFCRKLLKNSSHLDFGILEYLSDNVKLSTEVAALIEFAMKSKELDTIEDVEGASMTIEVDDEELRTEIEELTKRLYTAHSTAAVLDLAKEEEIGWSLMSEWTQSPIGKLPNNNSTLDLDLKFDDLAWLNEQGWLYIPIVTENDQDEQSVVIALSPQASHIELF